MGLGGFQVRLEDGLLEVAMPDESAGIDVDRGHRLRLIDHDMPAGLELHPAVKRFLNLVLHRVELEDGSLAGVELDAVAHLAQKPAGEVEHALERLVRVDAHPLDVRGGQLAQGADHQREILVHDAGPVDGGGLRVDRSPQLAEKRHVRRDDRVRASFRRGAHDVPVFRRPVLPGAVAGCGIVPGRAPGALAHHLAQALAFVLVLDPLRDPDRCPTGHVHQVARGNRYVRREARSLGAERILDDLHQHFLAVADEIGDRRCVAEHRYRFGPRRARSAISGDGGVVDLPGIRVGDVRCVKERRAVEPDIHEGGLHAGEDAAYPTLVDVAHEPAPVRTLDEDFLEHAAFDQRDPGLAWSDVDQQFGAHGSIRLAGFVARRFAVSPAARWRIPTRLRHRRY